MARDHTALLSTLAIPQYVERCQPSSGCSRLASRLDDSLILRPSIAVEDIDIRPGTASGKVTKVSPAPGSVGTMTSGREPEEAHCADTRVASSSGPDKAGRAGDEKGRERKLGEEAPGWTIMRPLSKKGKKMAESTRRASSSAHAGSSGEEADYDLHENLEALREVTSEDELLEDGEEERATRGGEAPGSAERTHDADARRNVGEYKVYKRRWFGVVQLVLLNTVVSWDVSLSVSCSELEASVSR
jgi:hypothetical protein